MFVYSKISPSDLDFRSIQPGPRLVLGLTVVEGALKPTELFAYIYYIRFQ